MNMTMEEIIKRWPVGPGIGTRYRDHSGQNGCLGSEQFLRAQRLGDQGLYRRGKPWMATSSGAKPLDINAQYEKQLRVLQG